MTSKVFTPLTDRLLFINLNIRSNVGTYIIKSGEYILLYINIPSTIDIYPNVYYNDCNFETRRRLCGI